MFLSTLWVCFQMKWYSKNKWNYVAYQKTFKNPKTRNPSSHFVTLKNKPRYEIYTILGMCIFFLTVIQLLESWLHAYITWTSLDTCIDNIIIYYVYNDVLSGDRHAGRYHNLSKYWKKIHTVLAIRGSFDR